MTCDVRRYAILEHHRDGTVHWDILVEDGPALRTWAVDQPIEPGKFIPGRELPPHRLIYLEYEGEISGNRGWVERWDAGQSEVLAWSDSEVQLRLAGVRLTGDIRLRRLESPETSCWEVFLGNLS